MAIDSGGRISEIAVQNVNPNPGFTDFVVLIYDRTGVVDFVCEKLNARQAEYIDLDAWHLIPPGFAGSAVIQVTGTTQRGGAGLAALVVGGSGRTLSDPDVAGDESAGYEAVPVWGNAFLPESQGAECP